MRPFALVAVLLLGCSDDAAPGRPSGLTAGDAGRSGSTQAGAGGSPVAVGGSAGAVSAAGQAGATAGHGGVDGGQAGQDAGGSDAGQAGGGGSAGAPSKTPVELGCSFAQACLDGRDGYNCPKGAEPDGCVRYLGGSLPWCCGAPKPAECNPAYAAGSSKATARNGDSGIGTVSLPAGATAWLTILAEVGAGETKPMAVKSTALPLGSPTQVCVGYQCADGSDGVKSCAIGQKVVDGITLCCLDSDYGTTGDAAKATPSCPNSGERIAYARFTSKAEACVDVKQIAFTSSAN